VTILIENNFPLDAIKYALSIRLDEKNFHLDLVPGIQDSTTPLEAACRNFVFEKSQASKLIIVFLVENQRVNVNERGKITNYGIKEKNALEILVNGCAFDMADYLISKGAKFGNRFFFLQSFR